ncbi:ParB family protein [Erwinia sp. S38]|uniref:ParB family protein n=1 Tax=Erwinia sp. S38 TaxID=2769338 RepID=UPI00190ADBB0|nr:ParB family protein [Erwinia sp. S38]MBK0000951.1 ParB/RepB/Spo0J family partition protein [Erwinia sp. S38]
MNIKRNTIGRTFSAPVLNSEPQAEPVKQIFTLSSGKKAVFTRVTVAAADVASKTFVVQETNGRDQAALTPESLEGITRTLRLQQFFPAIGVRKGETIEILDGSRRRASAILCNVGLDVLVTDVPLTAAEARNLAQDIQTAREHNIREVGLRLLALKESGLTQKEIAEDENLSQAKVTRALQAASVSAELLSIFPVQSELTYGDYKNLLAAEEMLATMDISIPELLDNIGSAVENIRAQSSLAEDEVKNKIIAEIRKEAALLVMTPEKDKVITTPLWDFSDKNRYARKKTRGRTFSYEFNRLPTDLQSAIDSAIAAVLAKHLKS